MAEQAPQVLCFGEMLFDCLADQLGRPAADVESWTNYPGGAPANVACALVKLGIPSGFIGRLGTDTAGDQLAQLLAKTGVNLAGLQRDTQRPSRLVYVTRTLEGDRQFAGFGEYATGVFADTAVETELIPASLFTQAKYLVMGTIALAYKDSKAATQRLVTLAQQHGVKIFLDINWRPVFWQDEATAKSQIQALIPAAAILKCTDEEGHWLFGSADPIVIQQQYPHLQGVLVTAGEKGCAYVLGDHAGHFPAFKVAVQDTTGAGDAFVAGFLHQALTTGGSLFSDGQLAAAAIRYASAVGAITTLNPGAIAAQPSPETVQAFLHSQTNT